MIIAISIFVIILDQFSKNIFSRVLTIEQTVPVVRNFFHLTLIHNKGIAFGMLKGHTNLVLSGIIIGLCLIFYGIKKDYFKVNIACFKKSPLVNIMAVSFVLGGAIGNLIDRLRLGYVVDFLDFRIWPVFNLADTFITIGGVILFFWLCYKKENS